MRILLVLPKEITGVEYHRLLIPHAKLKDLGHDLTAINAIDHQPDSFFYDFDIIVTSSVLSKIGNQKLVWAQVKKLGIPVVIDRDDTWILPKEHPMKADWDISKRGEQIIYNFQQADLVTCTNDYLSNIIGNYNKNVEVFPNTIDFDQPQFQVDEELKSKKGDLVNIGWSGSVTHLEDIKLIENTFTELLSDQTINEKYKLVLSGYQPNDIIWSEYERIFTSNYKINIDQFLRINGMDAMTYASAYDLMDIGLIPLKDNHFNLCKSELKLIEMGAKNLAVVVSDSPTYSKIAKHGVNCLVANKKTWFKEIKKLIQSKDLREELAFNLQSDVLSNWNINSLTEKRLNLYQNLIDNGKG